MSPTSMQRFFVSSFFSLALLNLVQAQIKLNPISGADGQWQSVTIDNEAVFRSTGTTGNYAPYLYLYTDTEVRNRTVYVELKYKDIGYGQLGIDYNGLSSLYTNAVNGRQNFLLDGKGTRTAVFQLVAADFKNGQNLGADLRIYSPITIQKHLISATLYFEPTPLWKEFDENWNGLYTGRKYTGKDVVDATTLNGKIICGYQGWFRATGDLVNQGWVHYFRNQTFANPTVDMWPDMTEYTADEKYPVPGWALKDGTRATLFSSANKRTVLRHFQWMQAYGIDGVAVQRFVGGLQANNPKEYNRIPAYAREAANRTGRTFYLMYDQSGVTGPDLVAKISSDWKYMVDSMKITKDNRYLYHQGKPVVSMFGFYPERFSSDLAHQVLDIFTQKGYEAFVIGSGEIFWHDANPPGWTPSWLSVYQRMGAYTPWNVGHYDSPDKNTANAATLRWSDDKSILAKAGSIYMPLVFPGFGWENLMQLKPGTSYVPRRKGELLWNQIVAAKQLGASAVYVAMFDEIDESTAIFKNTNNIPVNNYFATYEDLPADFYLLMTGLATSIIAGKQPLPKIMPNFAALSQPPIPDVIRPVYLETIGVNVKMTWSEVIHPTGIKNYQLELDGNLIANPVLASYAATLPNGIHTLRVRAINGLNNTGGWSEPQIFTVSDKVTAVHDRLESLPVSVRCYPNPFQQQTIIQIKNTKQLKLDVEVLDINGRVVRRLANANSAEDLQLTWDASADNGQALPTGMYLCRIRSEQAFLLQKLIRIN